MHFSAKRGIAIACCLSVCLSVRLSVTLVDCDHIGWDSSKIISPSVSLGCSLFATQTSLPTGLSAYKSSNISETRQDRTKVRLLLKSNIKSYTGFRLMPKSMTLDDLEGSLCALFQNTCVFRSSL